MHTRPAARHGTTLSVVPRPKCDDASVVGQRRVGVVLKLWTHTVDSSSGHGRCRVRRRTNTSARAGPLKYIESVVLTGADVAGTIQGCAGRVAGRCAHPSGRPLRRDAERRPAVECDHDGVVGQRAMQGSGGLRKCDGSSASIAFVGPEPLCCVDHLALPERMPYQHQCRGSSGQIHRIAFVDRPRFRVRSVASSPTRRLGAPHRHLAGK